MGDQEVKAMLVDCGYAVVFMFRSRAYRVQTPPEMRQILDAEWSAKQAAQSQPRGRKTDGHAS